MSFSDLAPSLIDLDAPKFPKVEQGLGRLRISFVKRLKGEAINETVEEIFLMESQKKQPRGEARLLKRFGRKLEARSTS